MAQSLPPQPKVLVRTGQIIGHGIQIGDKVRHNGDPAVVIDRHVGGSMLIRHDRTKEQYWVPPSRLTLIEQ